MCQDKCPSQESHFPTWNSPPRRVPLATPSTSGLQHRQCGVLTYLLLVSLRNRKQGEGRRAGGVRQAVGRAAGCAHAGMGRWQGALSEPEDSGPSKMSLSEAYRYYYKVSES